MLTLGRVGRPSLGNQRGRQRKKKPRSEGERGSSSLLPYLDNIRNLNTSGDQELWAISQATEDRPGECSMTKRHKDEGGTEGRKRPTSEPDPQKIDLWGVKNPAGKLARINKDAG